MPIYHFCRVTNVQIHGVEYRKGCALRVNEMDGSGQNDFPTYGTVEEILVWEDEKMFVVNILNTIEFCPHFMGYKVATSGEKSVVVIKDLSWAGVLNVIDKNGSHIIIEKNTASVEDPEMY